MRREGSSYNIVRWGWRWRWWWWWWWGWWWRCQTIVSKQCLSGVYDGTTVLSKQDTGFTTFVASVSRLLNLSYNPKWRTWNSKLMVFSMQSYQILLKKRWALRGLVGSDPSPRKGGLRMFTVRILFVPGGRFKQLLFSFLHLTSKGKWFQSHFFCSNVYRLFF